MSFPISHFFPLLLVMWAMLFWSRSKVFRATLLISLGVHAVFLVRVSGRATDNAIAEHIISFTFVQGASESEEPTTAGKVAFLPKVPPIAERAGLEDSGKGPAADREHPSSVEEKARVPESLRVEKGLPRIEDISLLDFSANPYAESYRRELQRLMARYQRTPPEVVENDLEARVKVWFNLSRDGKLSPPVFVDPKIRSSHDIINEAAKESVVAAAKYFPPFPEHVNQPEIWFFVHLDYGSVAFSGD